MRRWFVGIVFVSLLGCSKDHDGAAASASATASAPGPLQHLAECDAYFTKARACLGKLPDAERRQLQLSLDEFENQLRRADTDAARKSVAIGCTAQLEDLADNCGQGE